MNLQEIGLRIAQARKSRRLTLMDCKNATGISVSLISNLENGLLSEIGFSRLNALSSFLGLEIKIDEVKGYTLDEITRFNHEKETRHLQSFNL